jgi:hypothetical protein
MEFSMWQSIGDRVFLTLLKDIFDLDSIKNFLI